MSDFLFSEYATETLPDGKRVATVPDEELRNLLEAHGLAQATSEKFCLHPADALEPFNLVEDACVCGECGAVLKYYQPSEAQALGIQPGWTKLCAPLLEAEIRKALEPAVGLLEYIQTMTSPYCHASAHEILDWADSIATRNDSYKKLDKVRG